jgi:hypothetical protein
MSDMRGVKITRAGDNKTDMAEFVLPDGWSLDPSFAEIPSPYDKKQHLEGQHDKQGDEDEEGGETDADMSEQEYNYWSKEYFEQTDYADDGKKYTHTYKDSKTGRTKKVRYGAKGYSIAPGTKKGDAYCARSLGDMKSEGMDCSGPDRNTPMCLSRKKWRCKGAKSSK